MWDECRWGRRGGQTAVQRDLDSHSILASCPGWRSAPNKEYRLSNYFFSAYKATKDKTPAIIQRTSFSEYIYFAGLSQLSKFSTAHKPYTLRPFFFFSFSFSCKCTIELHFSGIFMAEIGVTTQHTRTKPKRITISDLWKLISQTHPHYVQVLYGC